MEELEGKDRREDRRGERARRLSPDLPAGAGFCSSFIGGTDSPVVACSESSATNRSEELPEEETRPGRPQNEQRSWRDDAHTR